MPGITTNTTQTELTSTVVIPELNSNEATIQNLTTQVNIPELESVTPTPNLAAATSTTELTTATDEPVSDVTAGKFARGLDSIASIDTFQLQTTKIFEDVYSVIDSFSSVMAYVRSITDQLSAADQYIEFTVNSTLIDAGTIVDSPEFVLQFGREYLDSILSSDTAPKFSVVAEYGDSVGISEYLTKAMTFIRSISDTDNVSIVDTFNKDIGTNLLEQNTASEFVSKTVDYIVAEATLSSVLDTDYSASLLKYLENYINIATEAPITPYKYFVELVNIGSETETVWNIFRDFADLVDATDDYYGAANLDDDQYASFNKTVSDWINTQELVLTSLGRFLTDQFNAQESNSSTIGKIQLSAITSSILLENTIGKNPQDLANSIEAVSTNSKPVKLDLVTTNDTFDRSLGRLLIEIQPVLDTAAINIASILLENTSNTEQIIKQMTFRRLLDDSVYLGDVEYKFSVSAQLLDVLTFADSASIEKYSLITDVTTSSDNFSIQVDYSRVFSELLDATDDYYGAATLGDDEYVSLLKTVVDANSIQEEFNAYTTKVFLDTVLNNSISSIVVEKPAVDTNSILLVNTNDIYKYVLETSISSEINFVVVTKPQEELLSLVEYFQSYSAYSRDASDTVTNSSDSTISISIDKSDSYSIADIFSSATSYIRNFSELKTLSETNQLDISIAKIDTQVITENILTEYSRAPILDQVIGSDSSTVQVSYIREFSELVDITDDYYGAATIGDDEYVTFNKAVNEYLQLQDSQYIVFDTSVTKTDVAAIIAPVYINIDKPAADISTVTSNEIFNDYYKVAVEPKNIVELVSNNLYKVSLDSGSISDYADILLTGIRFFTETLSNSEYLINTPSLLKSDQNFVSDTFSNITNFIREITELQNTSETQYFNIAAYIVDILNKSDTVRLSLNKLLFDTFIATDIVNTQTDYVRNFTDLLDATDDYYGAATVGDDEYVSFNKTVIDLISIAEETTPVTFTVYTSNDDQANSAEQKYLQVNLNTDIDYYTKSDLQYSLVDKNLADTDYIFEAVNASTSTNYSDSVTTFDDFSYSSAAYIDYIDSVINSDERLLESRPVLTDTTTASEVYSYFLVYIRQPIDILAINSSSDRRYVQVNKDLDNTNNIAYLNSNNLYLQPNKGIQDQKFVFDSLETALTASFGLYDTIHPTDDYYGAANIDDDEYAQFNKTSSDNYSVVDYPVYTTAIQKSELLSNFEQKTFNTAKNSLDTATISENLTYYKYAGAGLFIDQTLTSDSGTINNQNYFASTYVEPGYAGTNRTIGS